MPINSITTNDTIGIHVTRTSQLITAYNTLESAGAVNASITAQTAFGVANSAFANGNANFIVLQTAFGVANDAYIQANTARDTANLAFANANTTHTLTVAAFTQANTAYDAANTATAAAAPGFNAANAAFNQANTATTIGSGAFGQANTATTIGSGAYAQANTARTHANAAFATANSANATTGVSASTYGGATSVPVIAVDARGRITSASNVQISLPTLYQNSRIFTSTTSWTVPAGVTEVLVIAIGGGGGGGGSNWVNDFSPPQSGTGGFGGVAMDTISVIPGEVISAVIGAGGTGSVSTTGGTGGTSSFSSIQAIGGIGGVSTLDVQSSSGYASAGLAVNSSISIIESIPGVAALFGSLSASARANLTSVILNNKSIKIRPNASSSTAPLTFNPTGNTFPGAAGIGEFNNNSQSTGGVSGVVLIFWK